MNKSLISILMLACLFTAVSSMAAPSSLKVYVVEDDKPLVNVRVEAGGQRQRTGPEGAAVFDLNPGKYLVEGPGVKAEAWVFKDVQSVAVLQAADIKVKADKDSLGEYPYEGGTYKLGISYETPLSREVKLAPAGVPADWTVEIAPEVVKPDTKAQVVITVPEASRSGSECVQFLAYAGKQVLAATAPVKLNRGWKNKPKASGASGLEKSYPLTFAVQTTRTQGQGGAVIDTDLDVRFNGNLTSRLSGSALVRLTHAWAPEDSVSFVDFRTASLTYMLPLVNVTLGRIDLAPIVHSGEYFGSYLTLGQRRFDGVFALLPFSLFGTAGIDAQGFRLPPAAVSAGYFPNFFSFWPDQLSYDNGYFFADLKWPFLVYDHPLMITLIYSATTDYAYLKYSPLSGDPAAAINVNYTYSRNYSVYSEFAVCNVTEIKDTTALMVGASAKNLNAYTYGFIDEITMEYQVPLVSNSGNPLTGANPWHPSESEDQKGAWYVRAKASLEGLDLTLAATNSVGDFTFARPDRSAFQPNQEFTLNDNRTANEVADLGKTLISGSYNAIAFLITLGARF